MTVDALGADRAAFLDAANEVSDALESALVAAGGSLPVLRAIRDAVHAQHRAVLAFARISRTLDACRPLEMWGPEDPPT